MNIIEGPSPNHDPRADGAAVDILVLHYTGMRTAEEALSRLCDPQAKVSSHYTIDRDGTVYRHVAEELRARHAGVSYWAGVWDVNSHSIGIELVNPGHEFGYIPFAEAQIDALIDLSRGILARHPAITPSRVVGHSDVAPNRKEDPGELFPWAKLAQHGIGLWPMTRANPPLEGGSKFARRISARGESDQQHPPPIPSRAALAKESASPSRGEAEMISIFANNLRRYGYGVPPDPEWPLVDVIRAFQRHFRPSCIDGIADAECAAILDALLTAIE
jgi:N-acetylmuramoyl-L-alanine amidase